MENMGMLGGYGAGSSPSSYDSAAKMIRMPTMKERLDMAVAQAKERLANAERARELLEKNPDLEELLNIMQKGRF